MKKSHASFGIFLDVAIFKSPKTEVDQEISGFIQRSGA